MGASLEVRAKDTSQYATIAQFLTAQQSSGNGAGSAIDKINYTQNETAIQNLTNIIHAVKQLGLAVAIVLAGAALLIAFNTIRLAIYTSRDEIEIMNLVGAGHWYVRGPFMISGVLYGIISGIIVSHCCIRCARGWGRRRNNSSARSMYSPITLRRSA